MKIDSCSFCNKTEKNEEIVRIEKNFISLMAKPWFREGHCLVIPRRHVTTVGELTSDESGAILMELGRLSSLLDKGFGTGVMQKYQPLQAENGIKMNHLHFHVFPRKEHEDGLFPVPEPNTFDGFFKATDDEIDRFVKKLS